MTLFLVLVSCNSGQVKDPETVLISIAAKSLMVLKKRKS
ncbi:Variable outer membrane protein (plasmid) [Borrelia hermsii YBT]|uniref:Variable outer membrane protein n=1 Tax=Borrelia hermsii YBT TaxID=1313295 RepID=W5T268_BORHE|nr:Variable outer membrane protein [Borrelia hermsii YBT]